MFVHGSRNIYDVGDVDHSELPFDGRYNIVRGTLKRARVVPRAK